jgi:hypothetical protein
MLRCCDAAMLRCALTHNYGMNTCGCAKKSDRSFNPADMTAPLRLLSRWLRPGVFRAWKNAVLRTLTGPGNTPGNPDREIREGHLQEQRQQDEIADERADDGDGREKPEIEDGLDAGQ